MTPTLSLDHEEIFRTVSDSLYFCYDKTPARQTDFYALELEVSWILLTCILFTVPISGVGGRIYCFRGAPDSLGSLARETELLESA